MCCVNHIIVKMNVHQRTFPIAAATEFATFSLMYALTTCSSVDAVDNSRELPLTFPVSKNINLCTTIKNATSIPPTQAPNDANIMDKFLGFEKAMRFNAWKITIRS